MKSKKLLFIISVIAAVFLIIGIILICNLMKKEPAQSPKALLPANEFMSGKLDEGTIAWYNSILSIMNSDADSEEKEVVQEYSIANSLSFQGIEYINIKVFSDRTGVMIHKFYNSELEDEGEFVVHETFALTDEKIAQVESVFEDNNFWEIPSKHPDEEIGLDGYTVFIEGIKGNKYNIISMWCPDEKYEIKKIYDEIMHFATIWEPVR